MKREVRKGKEFRSKKTIDEVISSELALPCSLSTRSNGDITISTFIYLEFGLTDLFL